MYLYNKIGYSYDATRHPDPYIVQRLVYHLKVNPSYKYIDIACGSGNYTSAIADMGAHMYGIDVSSIMIDTAKAKTDKVRWFVGEAEKLPFSDDSFGGSICTLAVHHFASLQLAFNEAFRVIEKGAFVIFTSTREQMRNYWLNEYFPKAMNASIKQMPSFSEIKQSLENVGFSSLYTEIYNVENDLQDLFLYSGKNRPEIYLDSRIRSGISTFASLADEVEVNMGCERISMDIESGRIHKVVESSISNIGDYMFFVANK